METDIQYQYKTGSDCEVILALYEQYGVDFLDKLNGIFAFVLYDAETDDFLVARDAIGVIPLYIGHDSDGTVYVASELKALEGQCEHYEPFPPGHYCSSKSGCRIERWYKRPWMNYEGMHWATSDRTEAVSQVKQGLMAAVKRQLMSDVPYGVLLSGGLDSSVVSAIAKLYAAKRIETNDEHDAWWPRLHSFAVGLKGAPDLAKAREVADYIGTVHHEVNYTIQEGLDAIRDVIYFTETYDVTTVRASTPMYLLARVIRSMGIKMVLSGEGADEIFGGYLYFHKAPDSKAFHEETVRKLSKLHFYDCSAPRVGDEHPYERENASDRRSQYRFHDGSQEQACLFCPGEGDQRNDSCGNRQEFCDCRLRSKRPEKGQRYTRTQGRG